MRQSLWRPTGWPCCGAWAGNLERASAAPSTSEFWGSKGIAGGAVNETPVVTAHPEPSRHGMDKLPP